MRRTPIETSKKEFLEATKGMKQCGDNLLWIDRDGTKVVEVYEIKDDKYKWLDKKIDPKKCISSSGYNMVYTRRGCMLVHRMVAIAWLKNGKKKILEYEVNHKDGNKRNNGANNLEFVSHSENMQHAWDNGLMKNPTFNFKYYRDQEVLIFSDHTRMRMTPEEYVGWRIDRKMPIKGWMTEYTYKAKELLEGGQKHDA